MQCQKALDLGNRKCKQNQPDFDSTQSFLVSKLNEM